MIGGDGNVYEGVGWACEGAHTYGWNKKSAGIAFIGNFQGDKNCSINNRKKNNANGLVFESTKIVRFFSVIFSETEPPQKMLDVARKLIDCGKMAGLLKNDVKILGARQLISTLSPGIKLYEKIQTWSDWVSSP